MNVLSISRTKRNVDYDVYENVSEDDTNAENNSELRYVQQGIVSFGESKKCGHGGRPGIYTNVHQYLNWILDNAGE